MVAELEVAAEEPPRGETRPLLTTEEPLPVGVMTTLPAQALTGELSASTLAGGVALAAALFVGASGLFRFGLRRYASASS